MPTDRKKRIKNPQEARWEARYKSGSTPWEINKPDSNLIRTVTQRPVPPCKALDLGCGTGDNVIWLAQHGFEVTGVDISNTAVKEAAEKASAAGAACTFVALDFLKESVAGGPFGFIFDRGCFHSFDTPGERGKFAENVARHLKPRGLWLSLVGNADENRQKPGPPQRSASDIVTAVEPCFEILRMESGRFGSNGPNPPRAWICLAMKRNH